ncbi:hypothetical protein BJV78DRAFT_257748 [Lactifluus subvellereus]|nr:hypothetical protein BJV78DRAFT_257748 [Lactifluus subvellereus]
MGVLTSMSGWGTDLYPSQEASLIGIYFHLLYPVRVQRVFRGCLKVCSIVSGPGAICSIALLCPTHQTRFSVTRLYPCHSPFAFPAARRPSSLSFPVAFPRAHAGAYEASPLATSTRRSPTVTWTVNTVLSFPTSLPGMHVGDSHGRSRTLCASWRTGVIPHMPTAPTTWRRAQRTG